MDIVDFSESWVYILAVIILAGLLFYLGLYFLLKRYHKKIGANWRLKKIEEGLQKHTAKEEKIYIVCIVDKNREDSDDVCAKELLRIGGEYNRALADYEEAIIFLDSPKRRLSFIDNSDEILVLQRERACRNARQRYEETLCKVEAMKNGGRCKDDLARAFGVLAEGSYLRVNGYPVSALGLITQECDYEELLKERKLRLLKSISGRDTPLPLSDEEIASREANEGKPTDCPVPIKDAIMILNELYPPPNGPQYTVNIAAWSRTAKRHPALSLDTFPNGSTSQRYLHYGLQD